MNSKTLIHLSKDLIQPLEIERLSSCDTTIAQMTRALLRQILTQKGFYSLEEFGEEKLG